MPELPEVETIRGALAERLSGRRVAAAWAFESLKFTDVRRAAGSTLGDVRRRGKYLLIEMDGSARELVVHLGMTGRLTFESGWGPYDRARIVLDDETTLRYVDVRRFGRLAVVAAGCYAGLPTLATLGLEPWDPALTGPRLSAELARRNVPLKTALLGQRIVAGIGNIYADESLWAAAVNPVVKRLSPSRSERLIEALREVLERGLANGGTTLRDYRNLEGGVGSNQDHLLCYGRAGSDCPRCGEILRRKVVGARSTTYCHRCQRR